MRDDLFIVGDECAELQEHTVGCWCARLWDTRYVMWRVTCCAPREVAVCDLPACKASATARFAYLNFPFLHRKTKKLFISSK